MTQAAYNQYATAAANAFNIPVPIFQSLIQTESSWNASATSPVGAIGLTQLMPGTAAQVGVDPYDPLQNLAGGAKYLSQMFAQFGNWPDALAAYNAGPNNIAAGQGYAANVLAGASTLGYAPASGSTSATSAAPASTPASSVPSWLQGILTWAGFSSVSFANIALYGVVIGGLGVVGYFGIKALFAQTLGPENHA